MVNDILMILCYSYCEIAQTYSIFLIIEKLIDYIKVLKCGLVD